MMADTQYPIFFQCQNLAGQQARKIERYFNIRRKSGGGDCGPLTRVNDSVYSIAFRSQKDQQAVLERSEHVVDLGDGHAVTVRVSLEPRTARAPSESPQDIPASTPPPRGEEEELHLDFDHLDLNDDPKHDKELDAVSCSAPSAPEEGRSGSSETGTKPAPPFIPAQETFKHQGSTEDEQQQDQESTSKRIVVLGKTGSGKSNLANTIFGETLFDTDSSANSGTKTCQATTKSVNERRITFIDTPGFFDTEKKEDHLKSEIVKCFTESTTGPHAFLIVLKVEKYTEHEKDVIEKIYQCFSEEALKYAVVVFTHGDQLPEGMKIEEFVSENIDLKALVKKCGDRCHVVDNKYWKGDKEDDYRNNRFQVAELLKTIDKIAEENGGGYYTNDFLEKVQRQIETEKEHLRQSAGSEMSEEEITNKAKTSVLNKLLTRFGGTSSGVLLGAFLGVAGMVMARRI